MKSRTIVFLGKSGSGKDTQAEILAKKIELVLYISTGDLFREMQNKDTLIAKKTEEVLSKGGLIPAWLASFMWQKELSEKLKYGQNIIFPSSPRRLPEAKELDEVLEWLERGLSEAVLVDIPDEEVMTRLLKRSRFDDTEENIKERIAWFKSEVEPTIEYYEQQGRLHRVNGVGAVGEISKRINKILEIDD